LNIINQEKTNTKNKKRKYFEFNELDPKQDKQFSSYIQLSKSKFKPDLDKQYIKNFTYNYHNFDNKLNILDAKLNDKNIIFINKQSKAFKLIEKIFKSFENKEINERKSNLNNKRYSTKTNEKSNDSITYNNYNENRNKSNLNSMNSTFNKIIKKVSKNKNDSFGAFEKTNNSTNLNSKIEDNFLTISHDKIKQIILDNVFMNEMDLVVNFDKGIIFIDYEDISDTFDNKEFIRILGVLKNNLSKYKKLKLIVLIDPLNKSISSGSCNTQNNNDIKVNKISDSQKEINDVILHLEKTIKKYLAIEKPNFNQKSNFYWIPEIEFRKFSINEYIEIVNECFEIEHNENIRYDIPMILKVEASKIDDFANLFYSDFNKFYINKVIDFF
jgi:hypothetical protein